MVEKTKDRRIEGWTDTTDEIARNYFFLHDYRKELVANSTLIPKYFDSFKAQISRADRSLKAMGECLAVARQIEIDMMNPNLTIKELEKKTRQFIYDLDTKYAQNVDRFKKEIY